MPLSLYVTLIRSSSQVFRCFTLASALSVAFLSCRPSVGLLIEESSDQLASIAFGASAWQEYFGVDVGDVPELPGNIEVILHSKAPFLLEDESVPQRVGDNHLLTLIPGRIGGEDFTLDKLGALVLQNHNGHFTAFQDNNKEILGRNSRGYLYCGKRLTREHRQMPLVGTPYWVLVPKTVLQGSRNKTFSDQQAMIEEYNSHDYKLPSALEIATSLLAHYARSGGERLYADKNRKGLWTFTRCIDKHGDSLVVGGFESSGLYVNYLSHSADGLGVSCLRNF